MNIFVKIKLAIYFYFPPKSIYVLNIKHLFLQDEPLHYARLQYRQFNSLQ